MNQLRTTLEDPSVSYALALPVEPLPTSEEIAVVYLCPDDGAIALERAIST